MEPDSVAVQMDRALKALILILQEQADEIYQLQILNASFGSVLRETLLRTGVGAAEALSLFETAHARALQTTPKQKATNLETEFEKTIVLLRQLEQQMKSLN